MSWSRIADELAVPLGAHRSRAATRAGVGSRARAAARNDPRTVQSYVEPLAIDYFALILYFWKPGGEIDFVCGPRNAIDAVEVADWEKVNRQKATAPMRALPGRPAIVATRDELRLQGAVNLVPAALLLWALSGR